MWGKKAKRRFFGDQHWNQPHLWHMVAHTKKYRARVFCASMSDVFEDRPDLLNPRRRLWNTIRATTSLDWQLLTKRPENIENMVPKEWLKKPLPNIWYGTTAENQEWWDKRVPELLKVPAMLRFVSMEPLLGAVEMDLTGIHWVIVGGESGPKARLLETDWIYDIHEQCRKAEVPLFVKQLGKSFYEDDRWGNRKRVTLKDIAGRDMDEWPAELRFQEFPVLEEVKQ